MKLLLFSTQRQIRLWLTNFTNTTLDKHKTIGEFLKDIIIVKDKKFIDNDVRKIYLFEAIQNIDIAKLGFQKEFLSFSKDSDFIFSFLKEIFIENVDIDEIILSDTYVEYEEHLNLIKEIRNNYKKLLEENGYIDVFLIEDFEINHKLLEKIDEIEIYLDGYLSKFDIEILNKIDKKIIIDIKISKFNRPLIRKFLIDLDDGYKYRIDFHSKTILEKNKIFSNPDIDVSYFSKNFDEINFVFAKIAEFIESGIDADKIVVILPNEGFSDFLEEFDEYKNLNFAMGKSFTSSNLYIKLKAIYEFILNQDDLNKLKAGDWLDEFNQSDNILNFIKNKAENKELKLIDEELFKLEKFKNLFDTKKQFLYFILERLKEFSFDDVYSGKITTMGVLESRGMEYEGVILVNFNEGVVPNINSKDIFLNTSIRKKSGLPTRNDKENLQKHYYFSLIHSSKKVAISYIKNESESVSRFLYELDLEIGENQDEKYKEVLYKYNEKKELPIYNETFKIKMPLTPTTLKGLMECSKRYYFSKILKILNTNKNEENFGNVFHSALEEVIKNKDLINSNEEYYIELMNAIYSKLNSKIEIYNIRVKFEDSIKRFCYKDYEQMKYSNNLLEKWLDNFSCNGISLSCKVDRIDITDKKVILIDYKTGNMKNLLKEPYEFQLTFYYLWAKKNYPNKDIVTLYWDIQKGEMIEISPKIEHLKYVLNNLPQKVEMAKDVYDEDKLIKRATDICKYCDYKIGCGK